MFSRLCQCLWLSCPPLRLQSIAMFSLSWPAVVGRGASRSGTADRVKRSGSLHSTKICQCGCMWLTLFRFDKEALGQGGRY
jgi:hypothetical protein